MSQDDPIFQYAEKVRTWAQSLPDSVSVPPELEFVLEALESARACTDSTRHVRPYHLLGESDRAEIDSEGFWYLSRWVERGLFNPNITTPKNALETIAYHPAMPWNRGLWDVDHCKYAKAFYAKFPRAKSIPETEGQDHGETQVTKT